MKKLTISDFTTKNAVLAEVFLFIYVALLVTGFGINGECSPSGAAMCGIILSAVLVVSFGTKAMNDFENKR